MKNALRKWAYITKLEKMKLNQDIDGDKKITLVIKNQNDKIYIL